MNMFIQFSDQAWSVYSDDVEKNGEISQTVNYLIEKIRNDDSWIASKAKEDVGAEMCQ